MTQFIKYLITTTTLSGIAVGAGTGLVTGLNGNELFNSKYPNYKYTNQEVLSNMIYESCKGSLYYGIIGFVMPTFIPVGSLYAMYQYISHNHTK